jgi:hypothetical protein
MLGWRGRRYAATLDVRWHHSPEFCLAGTNYLAPPITGRLVALSATPVVYADCLKHTNTAFVC